MSVRGAVQSKARVYFVAQTGLVHQARHVIVRQDCFVVVRPSSELAIFRSKSKGGGTVVLRRFPVVAEGTSSGGQQLSPVDRLEVDKAAQEKRAGLKQCVGSFARGQVVILEHGQGARRVNHRSWG